MGFLNSNNFCRWLDPSSGTELTTDGDFSACSGGNLAYWNESDTSPLGDNVDAWTCGAGVADLATGAGDWSKGLSQEVQIKNNDTYYIEVAASAPFGGTQHLYILFVDIDDNYQIAKKISNLTGSSVVYNFYVKANADYSKIMAVSEIEGAGTFTTPVSYLKLNEFVESRCYYALPLIEDDTLNIFFNGVLDDSVDPFAGLQIDLINDNGTYLFNIASLTQIVISGNNYQFYFSWTVPLIAPGNYRFAITDSVEQLYLSNSFTTRTSKKYTSIVKYNNSVNALNYRYESAPSFYNQYRIDLRTGRPDYNENVKGYETYEGDLIKTKSDIQKLTEFNTRFFDEGAHEAFFSMLSHSEVLIDSVEYKKTRDGGYDVAWGEFDDNKIANGTVKLLEVDYSQAVQTC